MEVSGQLHTPAALSPGKEPLVPIYVSESGGLYVANSIPSHRECEVRLCSFFDIYLQRTYIVKFQNLIVCVCVCVCGASGRILKERYKAWLN
jgi:hypothetical protein